MQRRHDECTAAISTSALKESDGPSYFHLIDGQLSMRNYGEITRNISRKHSSHPISTEN